MCASVSYDHWYFSCYLWSAHDRAMHWTHLENNVCCFCNNSVKCCFCWSGCCPESSSLPFLSLFAFCCFAALLLLLKSCRGKLSPRNGTKECLLTSRCSWRALTYANVLSCWEETVCKFTSCFDSFSLAVIGLLASLFFVKRKTDVSSAVPLYLCVHFTCIREMYLLYV